MALGSRLKLARLKRDLTQEQVAQLVNHPKVTQRTVHQIESRDSETSRYATELANALKVPLEWLTRGIGADPFTLYATLNDAGDPEHSDLQKNLVNNYSLIPINGQIRMTGNGININYDELIAKEVISHPFAGPMTKAFQIFGGDMIRPFKDGWVLIIDQLEKPAQSEPVLFKLLDDTWLFGEFLFSQENTIEIESYANAGRKTIIKSEIKVIYPVVAIYPPSKKIKI